MWTLALQDGLGEPNHGMPSKRHNASALRALLFG
ncbi:hypothetical protein CI1B_78370 [Bradyrhizobium ivorense]|uniref:Uncharacterized protein n=1 Tax=Bradyrhizobium ivorense TaxID=2511166 RepID=A0A508TYU0_9BRAD|nr:hypothetical protein CI1B_78370 [Bradyrhizobium ivorense]